MSSKRDLERPVHDNFCSEHSSIAQPSSPNRADTLEAFSSTFIDFLSRIACMTRRNVLTEHSVLPALVATAGYSSSSVYLNQAQKAVVQARGVYLTFPPADRSPQLPARSARIKKSFQNSPSSLNFRAHFWKA